MRVHRGIRIARELLHTSVYVADHVLLLIPTTRQCAKQGRHYVDLTVSLGFCSYRYLPFMTQADLSSTLSFAVICFGSGSIGRNALGQGDDRKVSLPRSLIPVHGPSNFEI